MGQKLTASTGTWSGATPITFTYSWARCNSSGGSCSLLSATTNTYVAASADAGSTLRVTVTATNSAGSATATSAATAVITSPTTTTLGTALPARMPESSGSRAIYVSIGGSDSNSGTVTSPVKTLNKAFALAADGSDIYLRGGSYGPQLVIHRFYSASNPVTVTSYPGERAIFAGGSTEPGQGVDLLDLTGVRFRNVTFSARLQSGLKLTNVKHFELDHVLVRDNGRGMACRGSYSTVPSCGWGIGIVAVGLPGLSGYTNQYSADLQVWDSTFTNNGGYTTGMQGDIKHGHAMYLGAANATNNGGLDGFVLANNLVFDSVAGNAVQMGESARNGFVVNNTIDATDTRSMSGTTRCTDYSGAALDPWASGVTPKTSNIVIKNNIISNNCGPAISGSTSSNLLGIVVSNNLVYHNGYACDWSGCATNWSCAYGSYYLCTVGTNLPVADPKFVNPSGPWGSTSKDYHLQSASPALGTADPAYTPATDINGQARQVYTSSATTTTTTAPALGAFG